MKWKGGEIYDQFLSELRFKMCKFAEYWSCLSIIRSFVERFQHARNGSDSQLVPKDLLSTCQLISCCQLLPSGATVPLGNEHKINDVIMTDNDVIITDGGPVRHGSMVAHSPAVTNPQIIHRKIMDDTESQFGWIAKIHQLKTGILSRDDLHQSALLESVLVIACHSADTSIPPIGTAGRWPWTGVKVRDGACGHPLHRKAARTEKNKFQKKRYFTNINKFNCIINNKCVMLVDVNMLRT